MYEGNLTFKKIKARINHSYETFMDDSYNQREIHFKVLEKRFKPEQFDYLPALEERITQFLHELQEEVDMEVSSAQYGFLNELNEGEEQC